MRIVENYPILTFLIACAVSIAIMIVTDFILGAEAEHLNAWVIINKLFGNDVGLPDSLAIKHLGLYGAAFLMLLINSILGAVLVQILKGITRIIHLIV